MKKIVGMILIMTLLVGCGGKETLEEMVVRMVGNEVHTEKLGKLERVVEIKETELTEGKSIHMELNNENTRKTKKDTLNNTAKILREVFKDEEVKDITITWLNEMSNNNDTKMMPAIRVTMHKEDYIENMKGEDIEEKATDIFIKDVIK